MERRKAIGLLSAIAACIGFVALILGISAKKEALNIRAALKEDSERPWLQRKDWASGRISSSSRKAVLLLWVFVIFWCALSAGIIVAVALPQWYQGHRAALVALVFPIIGLVLIFFAFRTTLAWRRFGRSIFEMAALPAGAGGALEGQIRVRGRPRPEHGWHLFLCCVRRTTTGAANNRRTTEKILWQDEKWLRPDLPQTDANATGIPVFFQLPSDKPESSTTSGDGIHWRLEASASLSGPDFHAAFEVPVFKLPEPPVQISPDPTAQFQMTLDEIREQIHSKIQVVDLPDGREFVFPAARNPGYAAGATIFCLIWTAIVAVLAWNWRRIPLLLPLIFGAMDLFMLYFALDLWFRRSRVVVSGGAVKIETAWPGYTRRNSVKISEAAAFSAEIGATVGHFAYYDLKLRTRDGQELTLAKNLAHKPEADWLARQMTAAANPINA